MADALSPQEMRRLSGQTRGVYARNAARFDAERPRVLFERGWLERFCAHLPEGGRILDLGCGAGEPIARFFIERGHRVTGIDFAAPMLDLARLRWPDGDWRLADMRSLDLDERFDGIVGWDSFFHLTPDEQRAGLPRIAAHVADGGALLLTVGPGEGEVTGHVGDDVVYHASLDPGEYRAILQSAGLAVIDFVAEDPECDFHTVLLAVRAREGAAR